MPTLFFSLTAGLVFQIFNTSPQNWKKKCLHSFLMTTTEQLLCEHTETYTTTTNEQFLELHTVVNVTFTALLTLQCFLLVVSRCAFSATETSMRSQNY